MPMEAYAPEPEHQAQECYIFAQFVALCIRMDPLTAATAFSTIITLIAEFKSQRHADSGDEFNDFTSWLAENRHEELLSLVQQNYSTTLSIKALLATNRKVLEVRLALLDRALAGIASTLEGFSQLASAVHPEASLSPQAVAILKQFSSAGASHALEIKGGSAPHPALLFEDGSRGKIEFPEPQFIEDDLRSLVDLGLLRPDHNSTGSRMFWFTRMAAALVANSAKA